MLKSTADLKERLKGWVDWDDAAYHLGANLGFWPEFGAPGNALGPFDCWHGVKGIMWSNHSLGNALYHFLDELVLVGMLERREDPDIQYRWNPKYECSHSSKEERRSLKSTVEVSGSSGGANE